MGDQRRGEGGGRRREEGRGRGQEKGGGEGERMREERRGGGRVGGFCEFSNLIHVYCSRERNLLKCR